MTKLILENFLPYRLNRLGGWVSREFRRVYGPHHDLTIPEWRVLATLGEFDTMTANAIGAHSYMHKTKVSRAVRALEDRRWLSRQTNDRNRREENLSLTALGRQTYAEIVPRALAFEQALIDHLGDDAEVWLRVTDLLEAKVGFKAAAPAE